MELPNTKIRSVLPATPQMGNAGSLINAWNGGTVDTARSRLLVWGGGHADYYGNEMYALDLPEHEHQAHRRAEPAHVAEPNCTSALPDECST